MTSISLEEYKTLDDAYKFFNKKLFENKLPDCIITLHRKKGCAAYFWFNKYQSRIDNDDKISELALNPDTFSLYEDKNILQNLVHEMTHCWQHYESTPCRTGYHDKIFARKMKEIGLQPSTTGAEGGSETGAKMSDYIIENGLFDVAASEFLADGKKINWQSISDIDKNGSTVKKKPSRAKYECPNCEQLAWAKYESNLMCGNCEVKMIECE